MRTEFLLLLVLALGLSASNLQAQSSPEPIQLSLGDNGQERESVMERPAYFDGESDVERLEDEFEVENPFEKPIETERHDFTQSARTVGRGVVQLEYGFLYAHKNEGDLREDTYATPELMVRVGLSERLEFRTRTNYAWKQNNEEAELSGFEDIRFSIKYQLSEQEGRRPESAIELRLTAPTGDSDVSTGRWEPGVDWIYSWELNEYFTLAGSTGANSNALADVAFIDPESDPVDQFVAYTQSVALGAKLTRRSTGYFEWFGIFTDDRDDDVSLSFLNVGVDYLISNNVVIDFRVGSGLNSDSDDIFAGIGGAIRF